LAQALYPQKWSQEAITLFTDYVNAHMNKLKLLDLFSGIGGFSLGFEKTGSFETVAFCEKDKFCQSVLVKHWKHIKIYDEIRNLKGIQADVITGGFPCQPFSVAGKRKGTDDDRYLWDETLRVVAETKPRWFVGENVEGIVNISEGKVLQQIQKDLESEGFQVQCLIIPASGVGAWHQRKRVWIIAYSNSNRNRNEISKSNEKKNSFSQEHRQKFSTSRKSIGTNSNDVSNSNGRLRGRWTTIEQSGENEVRRIYSSKEEQARDDLRSKTIGCDAVSGKTENVSYSNEKRLEVKQRKSKNNGKKFQTIERNSIKRSWWQTQSELRGVPDGIQYGLDKDRANRIKALGNSIVPEIAYEIAKAILVAENEQTNGQVQRHRSYQHGIQ
jgi:DNA (cytosine-5)-methyltransferase 1